MRRRPGVTFALLSAALVMPLIFGELPAERVPLVRVHRIDGVIHPVTAAILERALTKANEERASLLLLELDTPGGMVDAAEKIVQQILASPIPVCAYVSPRGGHAASAGFMLLLAADVAAMAPVTRTGAAHPVTAGGENKEDDLLLKKAAQDLAALMRSAARQRGRPAELAEAAVLEARSWSAEEALEVGLIDLIAEDRQQLLDKLDGRTIKRVDGSELTLALAEAEIVIHSLDWIEEFKNVVLHPMVMSLLLALAALGIYIEFTHPGLILPGGVGVICLLIFLYGAQILPVNYFAAGLLVVGIILFVLEIKVTSYGMLTIGGAACLGLGMWLLFPGNVPGLRVSPGLLLPLIVTLVALVAAVTFIVARTMAKPVTTGREGLIGLTGRATSELAPEGTVFVRGEYWRARATTTLAADTPVRVVAVDGLVLRVEPVDSPYR
ncbi:MAG: nodulation protein NfeD [Acidobacteriota bacterium]|nr:MAG: nodulation protein NfeD [Acidobacteriota bacterium]